MKIEIIKNKEEIKNGGILIPVFTENQNAHVGKEHIEILNGLINNKKFKGDIGEQVTINILKEDKISPIMFLGLGKQEELNSETIRLSLGKALRKINEIKEEEITLNLFKSDKVCVKRMVKSIVEAALLTEYSFQKYLSKKKEFHLNKLNLINFNNEIDFEDAKLAIEEAEILASTTILARDLVNEPANILGPNELAKAAEKAGEEYGFEVEVLKEDAIEDLHMDAFLAVAKGSKKSPRLIVMRYFGDKDSEEILGFVGKGLTYDSGGYSIKPTDGMVTMKSDMGGSAAVIGAISAIAKSKLKINVVAVVAACENLISGKAYKPGDIINSMGNKTIEVLNTDAEGRLTLVDAVYYAIHKEKVTKVIDIATLTGAVLVALGKDVTGLVTNNNEFLESLKKASNMSGEKVWELPNFPEYKKLIKSDIADLKNIGGRWAGTITAGLFIGEFVGDTPWVHMDIAGTAWKDSEESYFTKGGTGVGVRTLYYLAKSMNS